MNQKLEEFNKNIKNKKIALIGLGVSNKPLIDHFYSLGAKVCAFDKREKEKIDKDIIDNLDRCNFKYFLGENYLENLKGFDYIFRSPSMRPDTKELIEEEKRGAINRTSTSFIKKPYNLYYR